LSDKAEEADVKSLIIKGKDEENDVKRRYFRVLLGLVAEKNPEVVEDIMRKEREEMGDALTRIMKDVIDEEVEKKVEKSKMDDIRNVMETLGLSIEKAMDALKIPADKRASYMAML
jgi:NACalpha-BTF3-like transcription factor